MTQYVHIDYSPLNRLPDEDAYREAGHAQDQARQAVGQIGAYRDALVAQMVAAQPREWGAQGEVARRLGVTQTTIGRHLKHHKERSMNRATRVAYDFGEELHIMDIDAQGVYVEGTVEVLPLDGDRDMTLEGAGYLPHGGWIMQGEAEGITVERT